MRAFLLLAGTAACLMHAMTIQGAEPPQPIAPPPRFGLALENQQPSVLDAPRPPISVPQPGLTPPPVPATLPQPDLGGDFLPLGNDQPTEAQMMGRMRQAEAAEEKAGPKVAAPGDDELRKLQIAKYNAAFGKLKSMEAAYRNGTVTFDAILEAQQRVLQVEYELSHQPADQIAALEGYLEAAKSLEAKVKSLYYSQSHGGEADKYYRAKFMRLDAEIQLLRAKRKFGFAK